MFPFKLEQLRQLNVLGGQADGGAVDRCATPAPHSAQTRCSRAQEDSGLEAHGDLGGGGGRSLSRARPVCGGCRCGPEVWGAARECAALDSQEPPLLCDTRAPQAGGTVTRAAQEGLSAPPPPGSYLLSLSSR